MSRFFIFKTVLLNTLLLFPFASSPALACSCRSKVSTMKANMHTFQTALEIYVVDHGVYPESAELLKSEAVKQNYWKSFKNPYTNMHGYGRSFGDMSEWEKGEAYKHKSAGYFWGLRVRWNPPVKTEYLTPGMVLYEYVKSGHYRIYGSDGDGVIIKDRGRNFYLSNE